MDFTVEVLEVGAEPVAVASGDYPKGPVADVLLPLMGRAHDYAWKKRGIRERHGHMIGIYKDAIEGGVRVGEKFMGEGGVYCTATPAGLAAHVHVIGPYRLLGKAHEAILAWSEANGRKLAGVNWEVYGGHYLDQRRVQADYGHLHYLLASGTSPEM